MAVCESEEDGKERDKKVEQEGKGKETVVTMPWFQGPDRNILCRERDA